MKRFREMMSCCLKRGSRSKDNHAEESTSHTTVLYHGNNSAGASAVVDEEEEDSNEIISEKDFNEKFLNLVNDLGLDESARVHVMTMSREKQMQLFKQMPKNQEFLANYPEKLEALCQPDCKIPLQVQAETLGRLRAFLRTERISAIESFLNSKGFDKLLDYIQIAARKFPGHETNDIAIGCLKSALNCQEGRKHVLSHYRAVNVIAECSLSSINKNIKARSTCLTILSGLCLIPGGHRKVIQSMSHVQKTAKERTRFQTLVYDLDYELLYENDYKYSMELKRNLIVFINSLISYGPGEKNLEFRLHLRYEFLMLGIEGILEKLKSLDEEDLTKHIEFFNFVRNNDEKEFCSKYAIKARFDSRSASSMFETLRQKYAISPVYTHILSILYHFLLIPNKSSSHTQQWKLLDNVIQEISILSKNGDDDADILGTNVKKLISRLTQEEIVKDTQKRLIDAENKIVEMKSYLDKKEKECQVKTEEKEVLLETLSGLKAKLEKDALEYKKQINDLSLKLEQTKQNGDTINRTSSYDGLSRNQTNSLSSAEFTTSTNNYILQESNIPPPFYQEENVPPPPPPPPVPGGFIPPPPPPPLLLGNVKKKNCPQPNQPTKCFNWTKIPETKITGTVWEELDDAKVYPILDLEDMTQKFSAYQGREQTSDGDQLIEKAGRSSRELSLIDGRRAQNCTIMLSKLKMSNWDLIQIVQNVDENDELSKDMCEQLLKFIPTCEEVQMLNEHIKEVENMAKSDRYLLEISRIDHYEGLLKCLYYKKKFNERFNDIAPQVKAVLNASKELKESRNLKSVLEIILAFGNFINKGQRSNAYGFKLSSLEKIADTKSSTNKKSTLLHYLVDVIDSKFENISHINEDLANVKLASKVALPEMEAEIHLLKNGFKEVELEVKYQDQKRLIGKSPFCQVMNEFMEVASCRLDNLSDEFQEMKSEYQNVLKLFGEDQTVQANEFFRYFDLFVHSIGEARNENLALKKQMKDEEEKKLKQDLKKTDKLQKKVQGSSDSPNGDLGEFDIMIKALIAGDAYDGMRGKMKKNQVRKLSNASEGFPTSLFGTHQKIPRSTTASQLSITDSPYEPRSNPRIYEGKRRGSAVTSSSVLTLGESRERIVAIS